MEHSSSFRSYARKKEMADDEYRRKTRKRVILISASAALLMVIVLAITIGAVVSKRNGGEGQNSSSPPTSSASSIKAVCSVTLYPDSCYSGISSVDGSNDTTDPEELFKLSLELAANALSNMSSLANSLLAGTNGTAAAAALEDCKELFDDAVDRFNDSIALLRPAAGEKTLTASKIDDLRTWLSAAVADQETCMDGFDNTTADTKARLAAAMKDATQFTSNSLAIATGFQRIVDKIDLGRINRKLLGAGAEYSGEPLWVSSSQRRTLLQANRELKPDVIVAKDGSGQFTRISEALHVVPQKNSSPFVIYIKEGVYEENVVVEKSKWNVVMVGDGMHKTIISGSLNNVDGTPTFKTGTLIALGKHFMARDIGFRNTAGPEKEQAVALRSSSDRSIFFRCSFEAFQDTLYVHSLRQFYRDCDIIGTVDFIFGDSQVVLQNCKIRPRQPLAGQKNTITAQGRKDPNENTGISIQGCTITPFDTVTVPTYLGRPWKQYSTTVIMQSEIGDVVEAQGWLEWESGTTPPDTIYYAEFENTGAGADVTSRVDWTGYHPKISGKEASKFAVEEFIQGSSWITNAGVDVRSSL